MGIVAIIVGVVDVVTVVAIGAFGASILSEYLGKKSKAVAPAEQEEQVTPLPEPEPVPEPVEEAVEELHLPAPVDHINAIEADEMLSDEVALAFVIEEDEDEPEEYDDDDEDDEEADAVVVPKAEAGPKTEGKRGFINIGDIDEAFEPDDHVTLDSLKHKGLVSKKIKRIKILADGELTKPLYIKAHSYSIQAIKMIELTGGTVIKIR